MTPSAKSDRFLEHFLPGTTPAVRRLREQIGSINRRYKNPPRMGRSILLLGESGVGKNYIARVIAGHLYWLRDPGLWEVPGADVRSRSLREVTAEHFAEVALPNLPTELVESELFGHVKGAFTGAESTKAGYFGSDHIEDLLLDEIGEAQPSLQAKLLQVLNDGTYKSIGAPPHAAASTEARVLLATNRDLAAEVRLGAFRADLYWRIQNLVLVIPPLRDQRDRIPDLASFIVDKILREHDLPAGSLRLKDEDLDWAGKQPWPGNVRELERLLWRWVYEEGTRSLAEIQTEYPEEDLGPRRHHASLAGVIRERVRSALDSREPLAASVGDFARDVEKEAQDVLYTLKSELKLDRSELARLFGDGDRAAKQISAWGERARRP